MRDREALRDGANMVLAEASPAQENIRAIDRALGPRCLAHARSLVR